jgi:sugar lactone lactonase YvrE
VTVSSLTAEVVLDARAELAEGPVWDADWGELVWVDIPGHAVQFFDPASGEDRSIDVGRPVGAAAFRASGGMVLALSDGFGFLDERTGEVEVVASVGEADPRARMNDGKCDPAGRFWAGTLTEPPKEGASALYRLDPDLRVTKVLAGVTISNGLGWSPDRGLMYYADSPTGGVDVLKYDESTGGVENRRRLITIPPELGVPDGLTVDAEGFLWIAVYGGSCVHRYSPDGELNAVVELPVSQATNCAFGGPDLAELYVTTGSEDFDPRKRAAEPHAGGIFRCRPGARGLPAGKFAG